MSTIIGLILLPLGCILAIGVTIALAWETAHLGTGDTPESAVSMTADIKAAIQKYKSHLLSPISLALLVYLIAFISILFMPAMGDLGMLLLFVIFIVFTAFSAVSPIINLFQPRWWLNTALYTVSWFLLFYGILGTLSWRVGEDMSVAAIGFGPAMVVALFSLPITASIKLVMYLSSRSQHHSPKHL